MAIMKCGHGCGKPAVSIFKCGKDVFRRCADSDVAFAEILRGAFKGETWTWERIVTYKVWDGIVL